MLLNVEPTPSHRDEMTSLCDSLEVLVVLMETVEVISVPLSKREKEKKLGISSTCKD